MTNVVYIGLMIGTKPGGTEQHWREIEAPLHTTPENTENGIFILKTQMFSDHSTPGKFENATELLLKREARGP